MLTATKGGVPPGYRVLDDSIGAQRVDPPDGYRWVADADGNAQLQQKTRGRIYNSVGDLPTPTGRFRGTYEPNPKHDRPSKDISPQPTNGAKALENSVPIGGNSTGRIGYDALNGEIVVFQNHRGGTFHGYTPSSWNELRQTEKNALIRAGLFTPKGRPVK